MKLTAKQRKMLTQIIVSGVLYGISMILLFTGVIGNDKSLLICFLAFAIPYLIVSYEVLISAVKNIAKGEIFDEQFLMILLLLEHLPFRNLKKPLQLCFYIRLENSSRAMQWASQESLFLI